MELKDVKWEWFLRHIKATSLYEIERLSFTGKSVVDACRFMITEDPYNYPFVGYPKIATPIQNSEVCMFKDAMESKAYDILSEMDSVGCFEHT